jgi:uncharacterized protein YecT (DUF1311 family)
LTLLAIVTTNVHAEPSGVLADCVRGHAEREYTTACIQGAQRQASDEMLAAFLEARQAVEVLDHAEGRDRLGAALTTSQRDFERYVQGQCTFVHTLFARAGIARLAALACEADLLKQRTAVLRSFAGAETRD